jgi:non-heme chloroperoxidase
MRAVALDARGHGDSDWAPDGCYDQDVMVEDVVCVLSAARQSATALVGASMGGGTSLVAVGEDRVDATALVLVDVAPRIDEAGRAARILKFMSQNPDGFESLEDVARAIADYQPQRRRPRTLDGLAKNVRRGEDGPLLLALGSQVPALGEPRPRDSAGSPRSVRARAQAADIARARLVSPMC